MRNIAIMTCEKVTHICAGGGCFDAFNNREKAFGPYRDEEITLKGFFHCGGCGCDRNGVDFQTKLRGLKKRGVELVHMAYCIEVECHQYEILFNMLGDEGFEVVKGTH